MLGAYECAIAAGTSVDGTPLRKGPAYLLAPGATLAFGDAQWKVEFKEQQGNMAGAEALFNSMLMGASEEVRNAAGK